MNDKNYKTKNNNYLISDRGWARFINSYGTHLRWVDDEELEYLTRVLELVDECPKPLNYPELPKVERYWQYIERSSQPELSSNGGVYDCLTRIEKYSNWDSFYVNGFKLVTNHLYNSDFEDQGWNSIYLKDEIDAQSFITQFMHGKEVTV
jgi:hypothetical protein